jgi:class 3 adenylate cyclase
MNTDITSVCGDHVVAVYDLENFTSISKKRPPGEVLTIIHELYTLAITGLDEAKPLLIKSIGDAGLIVFNTSAIDAVVLELYRLKQSMENHLKSKGFSNKLSFSCHTGEIAIGKIGMPPFESVDAFGEPINTAFMMTGKPFRGRFNISPQLFRKLHGDTRKVFHKYTPPIIYIAD